MLVHAVDDVGHAVSELCNLPETFAEAAPAGEHATLFSEGSSDEFDWELFDVGELGDSAGKGGSPGAKQRLQAALAARLRGRISPRRILLRDKLAFLLGSCQLWSVAYWLGWSPSTFYKMYTAQVLVLLAARWALYRAKRWHYYLLDFCYFANLLLLGHLWVAPRSALLSKVTHAFNTGPLAWSTVAFRNSMVYHDLDKVTSVFLHLGPACVSWTLLWHPDSSRFGLPPDAPAAERQAWDSATLMQLVGVPLLFYAAWAVAYYLKIFVVSAERIRQRGYVTLFTYVTTTTKGVYAAIAKRVPRQYRPQVYLFLHMCFCATTAAFSWLAWRSFALHTGLLAAMGAVSMWHGASYYFEVFAKRYLAELAKGSSADEAAQ
ncbi:hypothetical protein OEZ85_003336 [Tetradesmus obliquus]|uniref:Glycerophosphocholine acyltransferase 1 n=1 Tax=Tetradesmus obliquus TaxID=3088 RepID=A0ABY8UBE7_TETOB|nr:hypothetical protein OEZ85_003336 [Tetradesmus obliquus]